MVGVVEAGRDPEAEDIGGVKVGVVEGVDVGTKRQAEGVGELTRVRMAAISARCGRREWRPSDSMARFVHVGVVEGGDLCVRWSRRGPWPWSRPR